MQFVSEQWDLHRLEKEREKQERVCFLKKNVTVFILISFHIMLRHMCSRESVLTLLKYAMLNLLF